jgi:ABC-2 type transport system ATP-binding protein
MSDVAIDVQRVSKRFRLYKEKFTSLKERVVHAGRVPYEDFWALRGVDLEVGTGETVGILGRNGSGKSTLLKCIAGILLPTEGQVVVRGQLAAMLELGAGFQPDLTGRDNIYLNGSLLGLSRREMDRRFDDIVAFAELEQFIDNQVKFYSSGMYVRLGFAVAVNVEPDVLLVDEVLAVGDERFQQKCMERVHRFQQEGRTIVVVSHAADVLRQISSRVAVLDRGELVSYAPPGEAIRVFRERLLEAGASLPAGAPDEDGAGEAPPAGGRPFRFAAARLVRPAGGERPYLLPGEPLAVEVDYEVAEPVRGAVLGVAVYASNGSMVFEADSSVLPEGVFDLEPGTGRATLAFEEVPLLDGAYQVHLRLQEAGGGPVHDRLEPPVEFEVVNPGRATGVVALPFSVALHPGAGRGGAVALVAREGGA